MNKATVCALHREFFLSVAQVVSQMQFEIEIIAAQGKQFEFSVITDRHTGEMMVDATGISDKRWGDFVVKVAQEGLLNTLSSAIGDVIAGDLNEKADCIIGEFRFLLEITGYVLSGGAEVTPITDSCCICPKQIGEIHVRVQIFSIEE